MKIPVNLPLPALKVLHKIGEDISSARRRRRIPIKIMAARTRLSRATLGKIEKGDPTTSLGAYCAVLFVLGMLDRLRTIADSAHDVTGRQLEEERLPQRVRVPRSSTTKASHE